MRTILILVAAGLTACPAPSSITSVDGLAGGKLTSDIEVPTVRAETVATELVTASAVQVGAVIASTVEASTSMTAPAIDADRVVTDNLVVRGQAVFGSPLGAVPLPRIEDGRPGYRAADRQCREAFGATAHVCDGNEVMAAYRAGIDPPASMHQAAVNTFASYMTVRIFSGDEAQDHFVNVNDCNGWLSINSFGAGLSLSTGALTNSYPIVDTYLALHHDEATDSWSLRPPFLQANCDQVKLACCG